MEAEAVAYSVARYYGIGNLQSPNYIALHGLSSKELSSRMEFLHANISEIILGINPVSV